MCTRVQQPVPHVYTFLTGKPHTQLSPAAAAGQAGPGQTKGQWPWPVILETARCEDPGPGEREDKVCLARVSVRGWYNTQGLTHWGRGGPGLSLMSSRLDTEHKYRDRTKSASSSPALPCCPRPSPFYPRPCNAFPIPSPPCSVINLFSQNSTGDWNGY